MQTTLPVAETIGVIRNHSTGQHPLFDTPINLDVFYDLLQLLTYFNQFNFMVQYYRQTSGFAMGSSLSPAMNKIFIEWFESSLMDNIIIANIKPLFWHYYMDDVIYCFEG